MQKQSLNSAWRFHLGDVGERRWQGLDDSTWRVVDLPHDWSIDLDRAPDAPCGVAGGFFPMGRGYYRKTIDAPAEWNGKRVLVEFEGVYMNTEVWLNENYLGRHPYGYTSFIYDLTPYLKIGEPNVLGVSVDNTGQVNSRWYSGSGIYRPAWLYITEPIHVAHWGISVTTPEVSPEQATVHMEAKVVNESEAEQSVTVELHIQGPNGLQLSTETQGTLAAGETQAFVGSLQVPAPRLWSPEQPALYQQKTVVRVGGNIVDTASTTFGIRSLEFSAERGFLLNGQSIKMKGGCVHHDNGILGAASFPRSEERKVELLKASGYNAIRCAHNPPAPAFLDACDRLGMLVIDEAFDCWRDGKNPHDYHVVFDDWWQRDLTSMVLRDRNHPSVVIWSIGNEVLERDGRSNGAAIAQALAEHTRQLDPTRPVTSAINNVRNLPHTWLDTDPVFAALDIGGYNYLYKHYRPDHERVPDRIMMGTESTPMEALEQWASTTELSYVIGDFVWTSLDYLGESGIGRVYFGEMKKFLGDYPWHQAYCGDIDLAGFKRPQSYYRDILWNHGEKLYIAVHTPLPKGETANITYWGWPDVNANWTWPGNEGQPFKVDVYSACETVELFLNGRSLGVKPATQAERYIATFEVPYEPGELKAVGYGGDQPAAETSLRTTGAPAVLRLTPDRPMIQAEAGDLAFVTVEVVDADGNLNPGADNGITFTVDGAGSLAAVGSGNPTSTERYTASQRSAFQGRCVAVIKSAGQPGQIRLCAEAEGLKSAELVIEAR